MCLNDDNYVYYMRFVGLAAAASGVATLVLAQYLWSMPLMTDGLGWDVVALLAPLVAWLFGHSALSLHVVVLSTIVRVAVSVFIGTLGLLVFQVRMKRKTRRRRRRRRRSKGNRKRVIKQKLKEKAKNEDKKNKKKTGGNRARSN